MALTADKKDRKEKREDEKRAEAKCEE